MATQRTIKLDVLSDLICPWCYIAHRQMERAIEQAQAAKLPISFEIQYHPYILNPSLSVDVPVSKLVYFENKVGKEKADGLKAMMTVRAKQEGINLSWGGMIRQTTLAHRLLLKAHRSGGQDMQLRALLLIFKGYFEEEKDIGDVDVLADLSVEAGVVESKEEALKFLTSKDLEEEVVRMSAAAAKRGITGVPFTIIDGQWAVSGCQEPDVFLKIFEQLAMSETPSVQIQAGETCPMQKAKAAASNGTAIASAA